MEENKNRVDALLVSILKKVEEAKNSTDPVTQTPRTHVTLYNIPRKNMFYLGKCLKSKGYDAHPAGHDRRQTSIFWNLEVDWKRMINDEVKQT